MAFLSEINSFNSDKLKKVDEIAVRQKDGSTRLEKKDGEVVRIDPTSFPGFVPNNKLDLHVGLVRDYLAFGSQDVAASEKHIKKCKITHIINLVCNMVPCHFPDTVQYLKMQLLDLPNQNLYSTEDGSESALEKCAKYIDSCKEAGGRCFLHCNAGISRCASIVIGYLILRENLDYDTAYMHTDSARRIAPNVGFRLQLQKLAKEQEESRANSTSAPE